VYPTGVSWSASTDPLLRRTPWNGRSTWRRCKGGELVVVRGYRPIAAGELREQRRQAPADVVHLLQPDAEATAILAAAQEQAEAASVAVACVDSAPAPRCKKSALSAYFRLLERGARG
jgi:hypothetical protein